MPKIASLAAAGASRVMKTVRLPDGRTADMGRTDILPPDAADGPDAPNCKLIEQPAGFSLQSHFHCVDQFQIVVGGSGSIGRHAVRPMVVQYAGARTGYGPIVAGEEGISYLVFRLGVDTGAEWLPEARDRMGPGPRQYAVSDGVLPPMSATPEHAAQQEALRPQANGLSATLVDLPAGEHTEAGAAPERGRFIYVAAGAVEGWDQRLEAGACIALQAGEAAGLRAGPGGAQLLLMQFPKAQAA